MFHLGERSSFLRDCTIWRQSAIDFHQYGDGRKSAAPPLGAADRADGRQNGLTMVTPLTPHSPCNRLTPHKIFTSYTRHPPISMPPFSLIPSPSLQKFHVH